MFRQFVFTLVIAFLKHWPGPPNPWPMLLKKCMGLCLKNAFFLVFTQDVKII